MTFFSFVIDIYLWIGLIECRSIFQLFQAIFTAGYKAVLHIHAIVEECEIVELMQQIDPKTKKPMKKRPLFVKNGAVVLCRVQVSSND